MKNSPTKHNLSPLENSVQDFFECQKKFDTLTSKLSSLKAETALLDALLRAEKIIARGAHDKK